MAELSGWQLLPEKMVQLISTKIMPVQDHIRFRAACTQWRSKSPPKPRHLPPQLPWLMIPNNPNKVEDDKGMRLFYDHWTSKIFKIYLPETIGLMCCASHRGWLLLMDSGATQVFLLNPLTRDRVELPPFTTSVKFFLDNGEESFYDGQQWFEPADDYTVTKLLFTEDLLDQNYMVIIFLQLPGLTFFFQAGDKCWTELTNYYNNPYPDSYFMTYYSGGFYFINRAIWFQIRHNPYKVSRQHTFESDIRTAYKYLVEGKSGVFIVSVRNDDEEKQEELPKAQLHQVVEQPLRLEHVGETSDVAIFCGDHNHFLAVSADDWDLLDGGRMYMQFKSPVTITDEEVMSFYSIYSAKIPNGELEPVRTNIEVEPLSHPSAPALWLQPSFY